MKIFSHWLWRIYEGEKLWKLLWKFFSFHFHHDGWNEFSHFHVSHIINGETHYKLCFIVIYCPLIYFNAPVPQKKRENDFDIRKYFQYNEKFECSSYHSSNKLWVCHTYTHNNRNFFFFFESHFPFKSRRRCVTLFTLWKLLKSSWASE
jgi:hypothetical protein